MRSLSNTNITKMAAFVILLLAASVLSAGCSLLSRGQTAPVAEPYEAHSVSGKLESPDLNEASGIAASKCQPNVFWTHNDSGGKALLYAIDSTGKHLGVWKIDNAANRDWEDVAAIKSGNKCYVLIGEIGDNEHKYERIAVYRVAEPSVIPANSSSTAKEPLAAENADVSYINYPNGPQDAEALLAHPQNGEIYLLTKSNNSPSQIYKFSPRFEGETQTLENVGEITVPAIPNGSITGGDISPDGRRVILCDYFAGYELVLPDGSSKFDDIWKQKPARVDLGQRAIGEAVAYSSDGSFVIAVSEKKNTPVDITRRKVN